MKLLLSFTLLSLIALPACNEKLAAKPTMNERSRLSGQQRALAAEAAVRPALEQDLTAVGLVYGDPIFIRIFKQERLLELWIRNRKSARFELFRSYPVAGTSGDLGPKLAEGDGQMPEGFYFVPATAMNPNSQYHLAFNIGYPNAYDVANQRTGSSIMVHGNHITIGCFPMTDEKIEEIYSLGAAAHANGQAGFRVHIFPFQLTTERLAAEAKSPWYDFWQNLKQGYDFFETNQVPPNVTVEHQRYGFTAL